MPPLTRLKQLPLADREIIYGWCCDAAKTLQDVRGELAERYLISLSSDSQLSRFKNWHFQQMQWEQASNFTDDLEQLYQEHNPEASMEKVRQFSMAILLKKSLATGNDAFALQVFDRDLADRSARTKAAQKERDQELAERRVKVLEARLKEVEEVAESTLSPEEQRARLKEILK